MTVSSFKQVAKFVSILFQQIVLVITMWKRLTRRSTSHIQNLFVAITLLLLVRHKEMLNKLCFVCCNLSQRKIKPFIFQTLYSTLFMFKIKKTELTLRSTHNQRRQHCLTCKTINYQLKTNKNLVCTLVQNAIIPPNI